MNKIKEEEVRVKGTTRRNFTSPQFIQVGERNKRGESRVKRLRYVTYSTLFVRPNIHEVKLYVTSVLFSFYFFHPNTHEVKLYVILVNFLPSYSTLA